MDEQLKRLNELYVDIWHLHKKFFHLPESNKVEDWDKLIEEYQALEKKYKEDPELDQIREKLVLVVVKTLDEKHFAIFKGKEKVS